MVRYGTVRGQRGGEGAGKKSPGFLPQSDGALVFSMGLRSRLKTLTIVNSEHTDSFVNSIPTEK